MDPSEPVPIRQLRGHVTRGIYGKNTKSERTAVFVDTGTKRYLLRRKTGPAYADKELDQYVGHTVMCDGFILGTSLLADSIRVVK
ncbi:MAG: hypothetical protein H7X89_15390 [Rhizobiales bacterium]|nr:hypothetical protein [Hyphomicrobiales bacterium]